MGNPHGAGNRRQKPTSLPPPGNAIRLTTREINVGSILDRSKPGLNVGGNFTVSRAIAMVGVMAHSALPVVVSWGLTMSLIFGGCCSNVFALEAIVKEEKESGLLITFVQFLITTLLSWPAHFSAQHPPLFLKRPTVPITRWMPNVLLFFTVNMLNNFAFGFNISVPVHIILRSGGSVTTMMVGFLWGTRYSKGQMLGVAMLTIGVIIAAMADAKSKGKATSSSESSATSFITGLLILFFAQVLSAVMGIYTQATYAVYGPHWNENLFYSHFLSLPLFLPFLPSLYLQAKRLMASRPLAFGIPTIFYSEHLQSELLPELWRRVPVGLLPSQKQAIISIPTHLVSLLLNSLTQYACIRGVNLLGARTSALGVTIVLNLRKLVSLFASIWLFGNELSPGVLLGACIVFIGAGAYSLGEGSKGTGGKKKGH